MDPYVDTPEYREHRHQILNRDLGMCRVCGAGAHQLCWTTTEAFACCRYCAKAASGTRFPTLDALSAYVMSSPSRRKGRP